MAESPRPSSIHSSSGVSVLSFSFLEQTRIDMAQECRKYLAAYDAALARADETLKECRVYLDQFGKGTEEYGEMIAKIKEDVAEEMQRMQQAYRMAQEGLVTSRQTMLAIEQLRKDFKRADKSMHPSSSTLGRSSLPLRVSTTAGLGLLHSPVDTLVSGRSPANIPSPAALEQKLKQEVKLNVEVVEVEKEQESVKAEQEQVDCDIKAPMEAQDSPDATPVEESVVGIVELPEEPAANENSVAIEV